MSTNLVLLFPISRTHLHARVQLGTSFEYRLYFITFDKDNLGGRANLREVIGN